MTSGRATLCRWALAVVLGACAQRIPTGLVECPLLVVRGGTYGGIAGTDPRRYPPGSCVELYRDGRRVGRAFSDARSTFTLQFVIEEELRGDVDFALRVTSPDHTRVDSRTFTLSTVSQAIIGYEPDTTPLLPDEAGRIRFRGWLEPPRDGRTSPLGSVSLVNWSRGVIEPVVARPRIGEPFEATVAGGRGDCVAVASSHLAGRGGCWWPRGGGGCAALCTEGAFRSGTCPVGTATGECTTGRGRATIDVDERRSSLPPPETDSTIRVLPPPPDPIDAGRPDAPAPEAGPF